MPAAARDNAGVDSDTPRWSGDVHQADWIGRRLTPWEGELPITIFVPTGFEAYARVLHPVDEPGNGGPLVRWADVAAWSGLPLRRDARFHSVALPPADPGRPYPFGGQGPREGTLYVDDARALAAIARGWTSTPGDCWFCTDGFGPDAGPLVSLANRDYLLYRGPAEDVTATVTAGGYGQCASLWWPADHAWYVASDVDLPWTYVGGPRGFIDAILADERIEALPVSPDDPVSRVEDWAAAWVDELTDGLLAHGEASITTCRGTVRAWLRRPARLRKGALFTQVTATGGDRISSGDTTLSGPRDLRAELILYLTLAVLNLAGM